MERSRSGRAAGLRTHILVCLGACVASITGLYLHENYGADPSRIAAQVISGIGFLGTGTILIRNESEIVGLTTAACIWTTGCVGIALGYGLYWIAILASIMCFIIMKKLVVLEQGVKTKDSKLGIYVELKNASQTNEFIKQLKNKDIVLDNIIFTDAKPKNKHGIAFTAKVIVNMNNKDSIINELNESIYTEFAVITED